MLRPVYSLTVGSFQSSTSNAVGGPVRLVVDRDMDVASDSLDIQLTERAGIALGDAVTLELGHDDDRAAVFTGDVAEVAPLLEATRVRAVGKMHALVNLRVAAVYEQQSAGSIVSDLAGQAGLSSGTIDDGPTLPRFAIDRGVSAYRHVRDLARRLGYGLFTDREGKVVFRAVGGGAGLDAAGGLLGAAAAAAGLGGSGERYEFAKHLVAAAGTRRSGGPATIEVGGESPMSSQGDTTSYWLTTDDDENHGSSGDGSPAALFLDPVARTKDLAARFAAGHLATSRDRQHRVRVTILGRPSVDLGDPASVGGAPEELVNGDGYVRAIRHRFGAGQGFLSDLTVVVGGGS